MLVRCLLQSLLINGYIGIRSSPGALCCFNSLSSLQTPLRVTCISEILG